jgi:hypothetical protein
VTHRVPVLQKGDLVRETTVEEVMGRPVHFIAKSVRSKFASSTSSRIANLYRPAAAPYAPNDPKLRDERLDRQRQHAPVEPERKGGGGLGRGD